MSITIAMALLANQQSAQPPAAPPGATEPATKPAEDEPWRKRIEAIDVATSKVVDLRADFEQRRHTPLLKKPLVSKGVVLTKGERVRWDTTSPRASTLAVGGGEIQMYYPADKLVEVYPVGEGFKDLAGAPLPRLAVLKDRFEMSPLAVKDIGGDESRSDLFAVRLTPKNAELRKHVRLVDVLLDAPRGVATKVIMTDPEGERTEIFFSNIRLNTGVKDDEVLLKLSGDVRVSRPMGTGKEAKKEASPATEAGHEKPENKP